MTFGCGLGGGERDNTPTLFMFKGAGLNPWQTWEKSNPHCQKLMGQNDRTLSQKGKELWQSRGGGGGGVLHFLVLWDVLSVGRFVIYIFW